MLLQDPCPVRLVGRPISLFADVDPKERRQGDVKVTGGDQRLQVAKEKCQQQRRDVMPIGIGIGQQDDPLVPEVGEVETRPDPATDRREQVFDLFVLEQLFQRDVFGVQDLTAEG